MKIKINKKEFSDHLKGIILGGIIKEAVINFEKNKCFIKCIDENKTLFISSNFKCENEEDFKAGIKDLSLLEKIMGLVKEDDLTIEYRKNKFLFNKNNIKISVLDPGEILTYFDNEEKLNKVLDKCDQKIKVKIDKLKDLKNYLSIFSLQQLEFVIQDGKLLINSYRAQYNEFNLEISNVNYENDYNIIIDMKHFESILNYIFSMDFVDEVIFRFSEEDNLPLFIEYDNIKWALSPYYK